MLARSLPLYSHDTAVRLELSQRTPLDGLIIKSEASHVARDLWRVSGIVLVPVWRGAGFITGNAFVHVPVMRSITSTP